jgi:DNA-binding CsgD family transcriptional regulator/tetratricopeptide (TPR) repeat protein
MTAELLERDHELAALHTLLAEAIGEQGRIALITGEAGIGKTALVEHTTAHAPSGVRALWGACEALFAPRPLGPLFDIAQHLQPTIRALLDGDARRATLFATVLEDLRSTPSILVIEDLHWADEATLDFIKYLARRIVQTKTLLLLTYRDEELGRDHPLRLVMGDLPARDVTRLRLLPLSRDAVTTLAQQTAHPAQELQKLYAATGGNPFFVTEILASEDAQIPISVSDAVLGRVARRSPEARRLLEVVSVSPGRIERWALATLDVGNDAPLDECLAAGLLSLDGQMLAFRHELARQAVEGALSPARRQALNTQVLYTLLESEIEPASLARLAHHATQAADAALVLRFAPAAARQAAARGAHREAAAHCQTALRYTDQMAPEQHAGLLDGLSYELYLTGRFADAVKTCEEALALWRALDQPEKAGAALIHLSLLSFYLGTFIESRQQGMEAVELLETLPPGRELARAYANMSCAFMLKSDTAQAVSWGERAIALAERVGDLETVSAALAFMGSAEMLAGNPGGHVRLERALAIALEQSYEQPVAQAYSLLAGFSVACHAHDQAERYLRAGTAYCADHDMDFAGQWFRAYWAFMRLNQGEWTEAEEELTTLLSFPTLAPYRRIDPLVTLGLLRARRGDPGAQAALDEARDLSLPTTHPQVIGPMAAARAEWRWLRGDLAGCVAEATVGFALTQERHDLVSGRHLAIWLWRGGDLSEGPAGTYAPHALEIAGDWRGAAHAWEQLGCPYEQALALLDGDEAAQREALTIFERLGATPAAEIARKRLRQGGARGLPRGPRPATVANPAGLTPRQLEVLLLLAEGLSNPQIAARLSTSLKTVEHHVSMVLAKLPARSRAEAARLAVQLGLLPSSTALARHPS